MRSRALPLAKWNSNTLNAINQMKNSTTTTTLKLSVMMFLQFFIWGSWFATLFLVLGKGGLAEITGRSYGTLPIAAMVAPLFLGLIADRFFSSEKVMAALMLIGGALILMVPSAIAKGNGELVVWLITGHMLCYMPSIGVGNTIAFTHLPMDVFPKVRVWGTIGWIVAGLVAGALGWTDSVSLFYMAGVAAIVLGLFSFSLPNTPPPAANQPVNLRALLMVDAFSLFKKSSFLVFVLCSGLICVPLAYYYSNASGFLGNMGFEQAASAMTVGQMSEIVFMLLLPFFFRKLGVKMMVMIGMLAWISRYFLFAYGAPDQVVWMLFLGIALHGICYDFFFVTGFMYTDKVAPPAIRGQAQSMLIFFTQGVGLFFGFKIAEAKLAPVKESAGELQAAIGAARGDSSVSFWEGLMQMFSVSMPKEVDAGLLAQTSALWKSYWVFPAIMSIVVAVIFFLAFWDKAEDSDESENPEK